MTTALKTVKRKVLIMDDELMIRNMLAGMLKSLGWRVDSAENGEEALKIYEKALQDNSTYDLVILDLTVPGGMGGKETFQHMQRLNNSVKAIISSGYSDDTTASYYLKIGFKAIVPKPFTYDEIKKTLYNVLEKKR